MCAQCDFKYKTRFWWRKIFRKSEKSRERKIFICVGAHMLTIENRCVCAFKFPLRIILCCLQQSTLLVYLFRLFSVCARDTARNIFPLTRFLL